MWKCSSYRFLKRSDLKGKIDPIWTFNNIVIDIRLYIQKKFRFKTYFMYMLKITSIIWTINQY